MSNKLCEKLFDDRLRGYIMPHMESINTSKTNKKTPKNPLLGSDFLRKAMKQLDAIQPQNQELNGIGGLDQINSMAFQPSSSMKNMSVEDLSAIPGDRFMPLLIKLGYTPDQVANIRLQNHIQQALERLDQKCRAIIRLRYLYDGKKQPKLVKVANQLSIGSRYKVQTMERYALRIIQEHMNNIAHGLSIFSGGVLGNIP